jgi:hypothetical protein
VLKRWNRWRRSRRGIRARLVRPFLLPFFRSSLSSSPPFFHLQLTESTTVVDASFGEILTTCEKLRWVIANGEEILRPEQRPTPLILAHKKSKVVYEPLGVVAAIVSWNYRCVFSLLKSLL